MDFNVNKTAMTEINKEMECCPPFSPEDWDDKLFDWNQRKFIKDKVFTFFFMPVNFGGVMKRMDKLMRKAGAVSPNFLCLSDHTSQWNMNVYLEIDKEIEGAQNMTMSGRFHSKVYEGPFKDTGKWCKNYDQLLIEKGLKMKKMYMWYTTCPKCAKKYGKNFVVILSEVE